MSALPSGWKSLNRIFLDTKRVLCKLCTSDPIIRIRMHLTFPHRVPCLLIFVEEKIKKLAYTGIRTHDLEKDFPLLNHLSHHNSNNPVNPHLTSKVTLFHFQSEGLWRPQPRDRATSHRAAETNLRPRRRHRPLSRSELAAIGSVELVAVLLSSAVLYYSAAVFNFYLRYAIVKTLWP